MHEALMLDVSLNSQLQQQHFQLYSDTAAVDAKMKFKF